MIAIKPSMTNTIGTTVAVSGGFDDNAVALATKVCVDLDYFGRRGAVIAFLDGQCRRGRGGIMPYVL